MSEYVIFCGFYWLWTGGVCQNNCVYAENVNVSLPCLDVFIYFFIPVRHRIQAAADVLHSTPWLWWKSVETVRAALTPDSGNKNSRNVQVGVCFCMNPRHRRIIVSAATVLRSGYFSQLGRHCVWTYQMITWNKAYKYSCLSVVCAPPEDLSAVLYTVFLLWKEALTANRAFRVLWGMN